MENANSTNNISERPVAPIRVEKNSRTRKVYAGMWGNPEILVVTLGAFSLLGVVLFYFFVVRPASIHVEERRAQRDRIELELMSANAKYGDVISTETQVEKLILSVDDFESRFLRFEGNGRISLYQRLNSLIAGYGLVNTSGPDYDLLQINNRQAEQSEKERGRSRFQSLFPGIYVTMTVEGSYFNLRRFMRDLETSGDFVVISTVEIQAADRQKSDNTETRNASGSNAATTISKPRGKTRGETVSLHLELAAYFRRQAK